MHDQIQCNRVSVTTQGTVKLVAIRRLHCTCCIVSVALCLLYNVCCIAFVVLCVLLLCLLHCVCCIASRSKRSQVIGSTGLGGANSALRLLLPMSSSSAFCILFHSNCNRLQELPVYSWSMVGSVANQMREGAMFFCWASGHKNDVTGRVEAGGCQKYFQAMQWYHRPKRGPKPDMRTTCEFWNNTWNPQFYSRNIALTGSWS